MLHKQHLCIFTDALVSIKHSAKSNASKPYTFDIALEEAVLQAASCRQLLFASFYIKPFCFADFCYAGQVNMKITHVISQNVRVYQNEASLRCYIRIVNNKTYPALVMVFCSKTCYNLYTLQLIKLFSWCSRISQKYLQLLFPLHVSNAGTYICI